MKTTLHLMKSLLLWAGMVFYAMCTKTSGQTYFQKKFSYPQTTAYASVIKNTNDNGHIVAGNFGWNCLLAKLDSSGTMSWSRVYGLSDADDVIQTSDGGYAICGDTYQNWGTNHEIYILKTNAVGDTIWKRTFGTADNDYANSLLQLNDGSFIIAGATYPSGQGGNVLLIKLNNLGIIQWAKSFDAGFDENVYQIEKTSDNGFILSGISFENLIVIKTDMNGIIQWSKVYSDINGYDYGNFIKELADGTFVLCGTGASGTYSAFGILMKLDASGTPIWSKQFGYSGDNIRLNSLEILPDSGFSIIGSRGERTLLIRTNEGGDTLWTKNYLGNGYGINTTKDGYIVAGRFGFGSNWPQLLIVKTDSLGDANTCYQEKYAFYTGNLVVTDSSITPTTTNVLTAIGYSNFQSTYGYPAFLEDDFNISLNITGSNVSCNGGSNGAASAGVSGGLTPYNYLWSNAFITQNINFLQAGTYTCTVTDDFGCSKTDSLLVTEPSPVTALINKTDVCGIGNNNGQATIYPAGGNSPYSYLWNTNPAQTTSTATGMINGNYAFTVTDTNGCTYDSAITIMEHSPPPVPSITLNGLASFCYGDSAVLTSSASAVNLWNTTDSTQSIAVYSTGDYFVLVTDSNGCSSTSPITSIFVQSVFNEVFSSTICSGQTYFFGSQNLTAAGTYSETFSSVNGCDSTVTLTLTVNLNTSSALTETACNSYTLNSQTYTASGTYTQLLTNAAGCDSAITLNLSINQSTGSTLNETACNSYTLNSQTYTASGTYTQTLTNAAGCDSAITLNLAINQSTGSTLNETACNSFTLNSQTYTTSGTYTQILINALGCDSVMTLNLTINNNTYSTINDVTCNTYNWFQTGITYTSSGIYTDTIPNAMGCDSIIILNLTINYGLSTTNATACDLYMWRGNTYTISGTYTDSSLNNAIGCDSVFILNLTINPLPPTPTITANGTTLTSSSATGNQWYLNGNIISGATSQTYAVTQNGNYTVVVTSINNCSATSAQFNFTSIGVIEFTEDNTVVIIPNPNDGIFRLQTDGHITGNVVIYNTLGEIVYQSEIKKSELDLSDQPKGVYFIQIQSGDNLLNKKLIIE